MRLVHDKSNHIYDVCNITSVINNLRFAISYISLIPDIENR